MSEQTDDKKEIPPFADGARALHQQMVMRIRSLKRGLEAEIERCQREDDATALARCYCLFRELFVEDADSIEQEMKELKAVYTRLIEHDYPALLEDSGQPHIALLDFGRQVGTQVRTKCSVLKEDKERAIAYLQADQTAIKALEMGDYNAAIDALELGGRKNLASKLADDATQQVDPAYIIEEIKETTDGLENIVVPHIFPQTLSSLAKDLAEEGRALPDDIFNTYLQTTTTWRKIAKKG
jgi:hypothetical protein